MSIPNIVVINRQCDHSVLGATKVRPPGFSRERCFKSLKNTLGDNGELIVFHDGKTPAKFIEDTRVVTGQYGSDPASFIGMLEWVVLQGYPDDTIVFVNEDDYMYVPGWPNKVRDLFTYFNGAPFYASLYDHPDKYFYPQYRGLLSEVVCVNNQHWRTTPSTTSSHICTLKTIKDHLELLIWYPKNVRTTWDHDKFVALYKYGAKLFTPIPALSTHCELKYMSPIVDWSNIDKEVK